MDKIFIDLKNYSNNPNLEANMLIHKASYQKLREIIDGMAQIKACQNNELVNILPIEKQLITQRVTNTIFINGKRGAGKTTFLKSILTDYLKSSPSSKTKIVPIAFIDPTLIDTQQHLLVDIIVKMDMAVESQFKNCCDDKNRKEYREKLKAMSEGLKLLKNYHSHQPNDAQWFLSQALKESHHGQKLEEQFHEYIDIVRKMLGADFLIIAIDDVDTETQAAYEVLEIIRCYITHPNMAVIITGDEELYNFIVYEKKLESLGSNLLKNSESHSSQKIEMAFHLTQQYLLKILPAPQRLELQDIYSILTENPNMEISINTSFENNELLNEDIRGFWKKKLKHTLFLIEKEEDKFIEFILKQPIRTVLQLSSMLTVDKSSNPTYSLVTSLEKVFYTELYREQVSVNSIKQPNIDINQIAKNMVEVYSKYSELETGFYARPDTNNNFFNATQFYFSATIANYVNQNNHTKLSSEDNKNNIIGKMLEVMLTANAACNILLNFLIPYSQDSDLNLDSEELLLEYINYIGLNNKNNIYSVASHYTPIVLDSMIGGKKLLISCGVIRIKKRSDNKEHLKKLTPDYEIESLKLGIDSSGTISSLLKTLELIISDTMSKNGNSSLTNIAPSIFAGIAILTASHSISMSSNTSDYISVYTLMAFISELLKAPSSEVLEAVFFQRLEIPTFGSPSFIRRNNMNNGQEDLFEEKNYQEDNELRTNLSSFVRDIEEWVNFSSTNPTNVSSVLQGKIWTRLFYSLNRSSEDLRKFDGKGKEDLKGKDNDKNRVIYLHEVFSIQIIAIVNSFLIEECRFTDFDNLKNIDSEIVKEIRRELLTAENAITTIDKLEINLSKVIKVFDIFSKDKKELYNFCDYFPITGRLMSCPLLLPFLIYPLGDFDEYAKQYWKSTYKTIHKIIKDLLQEKSWKESFIDENDEFLNIDMRYISAIPIARSN